MHDRRLVIEAFEAPARAGGKISGDVAFYDCIALDVPVHGLSPRAPEDTEAHSRTATGYQGAG